MSAYLVKLLEMVSIERDNEKFFLHVKLTFEQVLELFWEIDEVTANNLIALSETKEKNQKYRLSFQSSWDSTKHQHICFVTKTYRDQSEKIYFVCTEKFVKDFNSIKSIQQSSEISNLAFLSSSLPVEEIIEVEAPIKKEEVKAVKNSRKPARVAVAMISVLSVLLLGYSGHSYINETAFAQQPNTAVESEKKDLRLEHKMAIAPVVTEEEEVTPTEASIVHAVTEEQEVVATGVHSLSHVHVSEKVAYSIPEGTVALTFDDGPTKYSQAIVDVLNSYQVGGTFFFAGLNVNKYPEYVQYVHENGFSIGNHSINHPNMTKLSDEEQEYELLETNRLIEGITKKPVSLFRPPYGAKNETTIRLMDQNNMKMILWSSDTEDWNDRHANEISDYVLDSKSSGSIILLHESQAVVDALPQIIEYLQGQDLRIVSLK